MDYCLKDFIIQVEKTKIPVIFYWITHTNVIVWVISPQGMDVKTVFLPEVAVNDKVNRVVNSIKSEHAIFDERSARELYTYLIAPFVNHLSHKQVLIMR